MTETVRLKRNAYCRKWRAENRQRVSDYNRQWRLNNEESRKRYMSKYRIENQDAIRAQGKKHRVKVWPIKREWQRNYRKNKWRTDPNFKMKLYLGNYVRHFLRGKKVGRTMDLLGCGIEDLWLYLESKFEHGMTRDNYGKVWHVDHIMPCSIFDLTKPEHQKRCFHFSNLQPMLAADNIRKSNKVMSNQFNLL